MNRNVPSLALALALVGCHAGFGESGPWLVDTAEPWTAVQASHVRSFHADGEHFVAPLSLAGLEARFDEDGVAFATPGGEPGPGLRLEAWGRRGSLIEPRSTMPILGEQVGVAQRLEYDHGDGLTAWWVGLDAALEQGWTVDEPPPGRGPLVFETAIDGALWLESDGDSARFADLAGREWSVSRLAAWDADGVPLPALLEADGELLRAVVDADGAAWPVTVDPLYGIAATTITGAGPYYFYGLYLATAGDVNGDGHDDLMVTAQDGMYSSGTTNVYLYLGYSGGVLEPATQVFSSPVYTDYLGYSLAGAGDLDGDGYDDIVLGAIGSSASHSGRAYVYHGTSSGISSTAARTLYATSGGSLATAFAGIPDIDGDGDDELAVSGTSSASAAYVAIYAGTPTGIGASYSYGMSGSATDGFGRALASGDFNGDGYGDLAVAAPYADYSTSITDSGEIYVYHSGPRGFSFTADTTIRGLAASSHFGSVLSGGRDINGDGYDDLVAGVGYYSGSNYFQLYLGSASGLSSSASATVTAPSGTSYFGVAVSALPDINGDGYDDVAASCHGYDSRRGAAWIYHGSSSGLDTTAVQLVEGENTSDYFGWALAGGDYDGDGYGDLASTAASWGDSQGRAYVYTGYDGDNDADGVLWDSDCDDDDPRVGGPSDWYQDSDGDGYGDASSSTSDCTAPTGYVADDTDCDDGDASVNPGATERCDAADVDEDCDGLADDRDGSVDPASLVDWYRDSDGDGYGDARWTLATCEQPSGWVSDDADCDDADAAINPGATEICDPGDTDEDCDGLADDADGSADSATMGTWYRDADGDGYGDASAPLTACEQPSGSLLDSSDCDDGDASVNPGADEICDASDTDEDCDGLADDADGSVLPVSMSVFFADGDGDGYGDVTSRVSACDAASGRVADATDCDDADAGVNPGAQEVCDAADVDEDCDGQADDLDPSVDSSTHASWYADSDGDGFGDAAVVSGACDLPAGFVADATDCDDGDAAVNPSADEVCDPSDVDEDCDGLADDNDPSVLPGSLLSWYGDGDGDGYGDAGAASASCEAPAGSVADATDCDDADAAINPGADEVCDEADTDEDCDGLADDADASVFSASATTWFSDVDGDGYGDPEVTTRACDQPDGSVGVEWATDCDDTNASIHPEGQEVCDEWDLDEDCDGLADDLDDSVDGSTMSTWYADRDGDGFGDPARAADSCDGTAGEVADDTDCDDDDASSHPGATDVPDDGIDQDCDGADATEPQADDTGDPSGDDTGSGGGGGKTGCSAVGSGAGSAGTLWWALVGLAVLRRRGRCG